jgi:hypothetical protein
MYRIHFSNHGYFAEATYPTIEAAIAAGKSICFEFTVHPIEDDGKPGYAILAWSPITGLRRLVQ